MMDSKKFNLDGHDHITLNNLMKLLRWASSGGEANQFIADEEVRVNGQVETQKRKKLRAGDVVEFEGKKIEIE